MSAGQVRGDYFDRARRAAVALLVVAGAAAIAGCFLDWVRIVERPRLQADMDFAPGERVEQPARTQPYSGVDARDGWIVVGASAVLLAAAAGLALRRRTAWLAFLSAVVIGAVGFAAYRSVGDIASSISRRMDVVGDPEPAVGVLLVACAGVAALLGSVLGMIASPRS